jgi:hypothetical protein
MKLQINCTNCKKHFFIEEKAMGRNYLMDEIGEYFEKRCTHCNVKKEYHINQVEAHESGLPKLLGVLVGLLIMIFISVFAWNKGAITNIGLIVGLGIIAASFSSRNSSAANAFNVYKIKPTTNK